MKKIVAIGHKYPDYATLHITYAERLLGTYWTPKSSKMPREIDWDLIRKVELESSDSAENAVE
jgi:hypothetical protein